MRQRWLACILLLVLSCPVPGAVAVTLETRDGTALVGSFTYEAGKLVGPDGTPLPVADIRQIRFEGKAAGDSTVATARGASDTIDVSALKAETASFVARFPDAGGVVLEDELAYTWRPDGTWVLRTRLIGLILKESHLQWADQGYPYVEGRSRVKYLHARSILPDGSVFEADLSKIKEIKPQMPPGMFFNATIAMLRIPHVKVGGLIDVLYEVETYNPYRKDFFFPIQNFQSADPVFRSVLTVTIPDSQPLFWETRNFPKERQEPATSVQDGLKRYVWTLNEVPPLVAEPLMPRGPDAIPYIQAALFEGWAPVCEWINGYWRPNTEPSPELASTAKGLVQGLTDEDEIIAAIYHWIQKNIRYIIIKGDVATTYGSYPAHETAKKQFGCCVDKAMVFTAMLKAVGVDSGPLLINAGAHDMSSRIANLGITHAITRVTRRDGSLQYLDCTGYDFRYPSYPTFDQGCNVLDPFRGSFDYIPVPKPEAHLRHLIATMSLDLNGGIKVLAERHSTGEVEAGIRGYFKSMKPQEREQFLTNVINGYGGRGAKLLEFREENLNEVAKPYVYSLAYEIGEYGEKVADLVILSIPGFLKALDFSEAAAPKRNYPIEYYSSSAVRDEGVLLLPEGLRIRSLPESFTLENPFFTFYGSYRSDDGRSIKFHGEFRRTAKRIELARHEEYRAAVRRVEHFIKQRIFLVRDQKGGRP